MRILLLTAYFPPDVGSAAHLFYELGTELVKQGHQVTVLTGMPGYHAQGDLEKYQGKRRIKEKVNGMDVVRISMPKKRTSMLGRALWHFGGAFLFFIQGLQLPEHDAAMLYSPPLPFGLTAWGWKKLRGWPYILNVQDLFPQSIIDLGLLKNPVIIKAFRAIERFLYRHSPKVTVHSSGNKEHVVEHGGDPNHVHVVPNWVHTDFIQPGERRNNFRREHGLDDEFVVSFAGVLGYSQDLDVILEAASLLEDKYDDIRWVIVGDGVEKERLEDKAQNMSLNSVLFVPMQPREKYPSVLHASDVGLATLHGDVKTPVVPSKILSIMAAGISVVSAMNLDGDAPKLISKAGCGINLPPEDPEALAEAVLRLRDDPSFCKEMGDNGRTYAVEHLSLEVRAKQYEQLLGELIR